MELHDIGAARLENTARFLGLIFVYLLIGGIFGLLPLYAGRRSGRARLGLGGFFTCVLGGGVFGLVALVPITFLFTTFILLLGKPEAKTWASSQAVSNPHKFASWFAMLHFMFCIIIGAAVAGFEILAGMPSGGFAPIALIVDAVDKTILLLEAPVALVLWVLYHPTARFQPPSFFVIDFVDKSQLLVVVTLCLIWSILLGYLVSFGIRKFNK